MKSRVAGITTTVAILAVSLSAAMTPSPATAQIASATAATPAIAPIKKVDPSLIPELRADMLSARAEAQSWLDKSVAAKRELDQRVNEMDRWKAQIADVDKDREIFKRNFDAYEAAVVQHNASTDSVDAHNASAVAAYNAEGDQLDARKAALEQERANYLTRDDEINKETAALNERIATLVHDWKNFLFAHERAKARADDLTGVLAAQGGSADGP